ncbi:MULTISPECIES: hypothetical protein [unclassified Streptomyces]|uniref:hypothetical protein n=1 Tax=unclassified Streptomyces TaxID=2593676 RepID=UPI00336A723A
MAPTTCQDLYNQDLLTRVVRFLGWSDRDSLWQAIQCGLTVEQARTYVRNKYLQLLNDPKFWDAEVSELYTLYRRGCELEFSQLPQPVKDEIRDVDRYQKFRPLMLQAVTEPLITLLNLQQWTFLGSPVLVAREFCDRLKEVDRNFRAELRTLRQEGQYKQLTAVTVGSFEWRARAGRVGRPDKFTNHMLGRAVDIRSATNPIIKGATARAADAILDFLNDPELIDPQVPSGQLRFTGSALTVDVKHLQDSTPEETSLSYSRIVKMTEVLRQFLCDTIDERRRLESIIGNPALDPDVRNEATEQLRGEGFLLWDRLALAVGSEQGSKGAANAQAHGSKILFTWCTRGLFTLPLPLVAAFVTARLRWGGEYAESKDPMHFEDPAKEHHDCERILAPFLRVLERR